MPDADEHLASEGRPRRTHGAQPDVFEPVGRWLDVATSPAARSLAQQWAAVAARPDLLASATLYLAQEYGSIALDLAQRLLGVPPAAGPAAPDGERAFADPAWRDASWFAALRRAYGSTSRTLLELGDAVDGLDAGARDKARFFTQQALAAMSPANFPWSNPLVLREALDTSGASLWRGLLNLGRAFDATTGSLRLPMSDPSAWEVGRNLAVTPGEVVWQNDLMQLIQYAPATPRVARRPLLVVPPWLNKYYVLDLQPANSIVRWLVEQGHTVFLISWVNPDASHADKRLDDYLREGPLEALDVIERATGEREVNAVGYCLGGILLACTAAWLAARRDARLRSITLLTALLDYADVGEIRAFVDEDELARLERTGARKGYIPGGGVAWAFRMLRPGDLIWSFWIDQYLRGREPQPFDLLYWNEDATNMPLRAHLDYMRKCYIDNALREPGGVTLAGESIDLGRVRTPAYVVATRDDHIAPWRSAWRSARLFSGRVRFVLGESGHIAGIVNPPARTKYRYHVAAEGGDDPDAWLASARAHPGSWWPDWQRWLARHAGGAVRARSAGGKGAPAIERAPGSYVRRRIEDIE
jgi:polyhydroxyalkanoate synthase